MMFLDELSDFDSDTGDAATPMAHLLGTADAYRKASLLQLYLTFEDLEVKQTEQTSLENLFNMSNARSDCVSGVSRSQKISQLALENSFNSKKDPVRLGCEIYASNPLPGSCPGS